MDESISISNNLVKQCIFWWYDDFLVLTSGIGPMCVFVWVIFHVLCTICCIQIAVTTHDMNNNSRPHYLRLKLRNEKQQRTNTFHVILGKYRIWIFNKKQKQNFELFEFLFIVSFFSNVTHWETYWFSYM